MVPLPAGRRPGTHAARDDPFDVLTAGERRQLEARPHPRSVDPMLATLAAMPPSGGSWVYERKLDGVRVLGHCHSGDVRLRSRSHQPLEGTYPEVVEALQAQPVDDAVFDGEVVAFDGDRTSFERLQGRMQLTDPARALRTGIEVHYYLFDVVHLDGHGTGRLGLEARKRLLAAAVVPASPLRTTDHREGSGADLLAAACGAGWEGLIAKRHGSSYQQRRSRDWLKLKCSRRQELVVGGWTEPEGTRTGLGALVVGYWDAGDFVYAGKVGTGFTEGVLRELRARLADLETPGTPFTRGQPPRRRVHWVTPHLVCEVAFTEWTRDGRLRHPRFEGLRFDKDPSGVVREEA